MLPAWVALLHGQSRPISVVEALLKKRQAAELLPKLT